MGKKLGVRSIDSLRHHSDLPDGTTFWKPEHPRVSGFQTCLRWGKPRWRASLLWDGNPCVRGIERDWNPILRGSDGSKDGYFFGGMWVSLPERFPHFASCTITSVATTAANAKDTAEKMRKATNNSAMKCLPRKPDVSRYVAAQNCGTNAQRPRAVSTLSTVIQIVRRPTMPRTRPNMRPTVIPTKSMGVK